MKAIRFVIYGIGLIISVCLIVFLCTEINVQALDYIDNSAASFSPIRKNDEAQKSIIVNKQTTKYENLSITNTDNVNSNFQSKFIPAISEKNTYSWNPTKYNSDLEHDEPEVSELDNKSYLGKYYITGYDICIECCGKTDGITASGAVATVGRTVAMNGVPFGTRIYIEGIGERVVEDRGGMSSGVIDVLCSNHAECYAITGSYDVYIIN